MNLELKQVISIFGMMIIKQKYFTWPKLKFTYFKENNNNNFKFTWTKSKVTHLMKTKIIFKFISFLINNNFMLTKIID